MVESYLAKMYTVKKNPSKIELLQCLLGLQLMELTGFRTFSELIREHQLHLSLIRKSAESSWIV
jgi:hypothetical protein